MGAVRLQHEGGGFRGQTRRRRRNTRRRRGLRQHRAVLAQAVRAAHERTGGSRAQPRAPDRPRRLRGVSQCQAHVILAAVPQRELCDLRRPCAGNDWEG